MIATVEHRYRQVNRVSEPIEWLTGHGSYYTARDSRAPARHIGLISCTIPISGPQFYEMDETFVRTLKHYYDRVSHRPDTPSVLDRLPGSSDHYNEMHRGALFAIDHP